MWILSLALVLGILAGSSVFAAQSTAPASPAAAPGEPHPHHTEAQIYRHDEHRAEQKSEAEETNEYRHSASVQWFAKLLHVDVETAATIFEYINFAVIVLAIGIPLTRMIPATLRKRSARLTVELENAQARTADANERLSAVEARLAGLDAEINLIRKQVEEDMRSDEVRGKALLEEEMARVVAAAEQEIAMAGAQAQRGLKQFAADLAIDRAVSQLTIDAETDRALFAEFAHDIAGPRGKAKRSPASSDRGGQN